MSNIAIGLTIGVTSGVVTTALIWLITVIWRRQLLPWYEERVYKGIRIQGTWTLEADTNVKDPWAHSETITLVQKAHRLSGIATLTSQSNPDQTPSSLLIEGEISDRIVSLRLESPLKDRLSFSVLLLEVVGNGTQLSGEVGFYNVETSSIQSSSVRYQKNV